MIINLTTRTPRREANTFLAGAAIDCFAAAAHSTLTSGRAVVTLLWRHRLSSSMTSFVKSPGRLLTWLLQRSGTPGQEGAPSPKYLQNTKEVFCAKKTFLQIFA